MIKIVRAQRKQVDVVAQILGEAFSDDPVTKWISPNVRWMHSYFCVLYKHFFLPYGEVYLTQDASGAALWLPPQRTMRQFPVLRSIEILGGIFSTSGASAALRSMMTAVYFDFHHLKEPHYYLHAIGVRKKRTENGLGTRLIQEVLTRCDHESVPAYLENTNIRNMAFYQRLGFKVISNIKFPGQGPELWLMLRRPAKNKVHDGAI
jgi:ribosomal protein S18 acetylase RimI-like enzyme